MNEIEDNNDEMTAFKAATLTDYFFLFILQAFHAVMAALQIHLHNCRLSEVNGTCL